MHVIIGQLGVTRILEFIGYGNFFKKIVCSMHFIEG
jgi:hypothetical protein